MGLNKRQPHHWEPIRKKRNKILEITDTYMMPDRLTDSQYSELLEYRNKLRNLTEQTQVATLVEWPVKPTFIKENLDE